MARNDSEASRLRIKLPLHTIPANSPKTVEAHESSGKTGRGCFSASCTSAVGALSLMTTSPSDSASMLHLNSPRPVFPDDSWASTVFGEFAEIVCRGSFIRKRLTSESFRAITGAIAGDQVTCGISSVRMREYYAVIANRQSNKNYTLDCAIR